MKTAVHAVTGEGAPALIARLTAARSDWAAIPARGCPCCVGRAALQVELVKLLRTRSVRRVFVELRDASHHAALTRVLAEGPIAREVEPGRTLRLPQDAEIAPATLER